MIRIILAGAGGRMGRAISALAAEIEGAKIVAGIDPAMGTSFANCTAAADVVIDFATPKALVDELAFCVDRGLPLVLASTGHGPEADALVDEAAEKIAIVRSANFSYGAYVLARLAKEAHQLLGSAYDVSICEAHHRAKKDAPSGTAKLLAEAMDMPDMPMVSLRGGAVVGTHEVFFLGDRDVITVKHEALDRRLFAEGALHAANWIAGCAPGLYGMADFIASRETWTR